MNTKQIMMIAAGMGVPDLLRMERDSQAAKERYWYKIGSRCCNCKKICDPQEVFCSDECRDGYSK